MKNNLKRIMCVNIKMLKKIITIISWLQPPSAVILEPRKVNSATVSTITPSICYEVMELVVMILVF